MAIFPEYESFDGLGLAGLVEEGVMSPLELLETAIDRIERRNPALNAVIYKMYDEAHRNLHRLGKGPFLGVPFLLKDMLADYQGEPITYGSRFMQGYTSPFDSEIVKCFKQSGLNILGKTNLPEFGLSPVTEPELFGPTHNPWDLTKSCGGSSGGSAAAVASGMVPMAHGSDGGGSIRIPAAYCGLFGLKPSRGRTSNGAYDVLNTLVVEHVITRSVRDSAAMLDLLSAKSSTLPMLHKPSVSFLESLQVPLPSLRIGFTEKPIFNGTVNPEYRDALKKAVKLCEGLGHHLTPVHFDIKGEDLEQAYLIMFSAESAASIDWLRKKLPKTGLNKLEPATAVLYEIGEHFSAKDLAWATQIMHLAGQYFASLAETNDVLMMPTMPVPPPKIGEFKPDRLEHPILEILRHVPYGPLLNRLTHHISVKYFSLISFTPIFNMTGQPAMSVPLFRDKDGLPIGIQFAAQYGDEKTLLQLAQQLEEAGPWVRCAAV